MLAALALLALAPLSRHSFVEVHMGGSVRVSVYAASREQAERAARAAYARFAELEQILSDYRVDSELNRLTREGGGETSPDLAQVIERSLDVSRQTGGAFDITAKPVIDLWREARRTGELPAAAALSDALAKVDYRQIRLEGQRLSIDPNVTRIDLGGIAKGYACDAALETIRSNGIRSALVQAGGDLRLGDAPPGTLGWDILLAGERAPRRLENVGISTSGDTEQFLQIGETRYSHIVDPRTGYGVTTRVRVSVIGPDAFTTDPLATAFCVLGPDQSRKVAAENHVLALFDVAP